MTVTVPPTPVAGEATRAAQTKKGVAGKAKRAGWFAR